MLQVTKQALQPHACSDREERAHRKGPSGFSEWTDMETVAVMSGTGAGAEDALPGPAGPKDD